MTGCVRSETANRAGAGLVRVRGVTVPMVQCNGHETSEPLTHDAWRVGSSFPYRKAFPAYMKCGGITAAEPHACYTS